MSENLLPGAYSRQVAQLIQRLSETEGAIQALASGEIDAVIDPATAATILLGKAQEALARSEARYRDLVARCPALVCELAPDGTILFVNDAVTNVLGYHPEELMGKCWRSTLVPD